MPKPVKKLPIPPKPKRPTDPNRAVHVMMAEHLARLENPAPVPSSFEEQYRARMAELGSKGGKVSGAKRMQMPAAKRKAIAKKAAAARWKNRPDQS
jgi:hypothetical protein